LFFSLVKLLLLYSDTLIGNTFGYFLRTPCNCLQLWEDSSIWSPGKERGDWTLVCNQIVSKNQTKKVLFYTTVNLNCITFTRKKLHKDPKSPCKCTEKKKTCNETPAVWVLLVNVFSICPSAISKRTQTASVIIAGPALWPKRSAEFPRWQLHCFIMMHYKEKHVWSSINSVCACVRGCVCLRH